MSSIKRSRALVISNIPWDFVWQRHQSIATLLAQDYDVGFVELTGTRGARWRDAGRILAHLGGALRRFFKEKKAGDPCPVWLTRPLVLPAINRVSCAVNQRLMTRWMARDERLRMHFDLVVCYAQTRTALQILDGISYDRLVYDCTDDWLQVDGIPTTLADDEAELMQRAALTLVPSRTLWARKEGLARHCVQLPHGVWLDRFMVTEREPASAELVRVVYYGHLLRQHLDFDAIDRLAKARPNWRITLIGPIKSRPSFPPNVELPGQVAHEKLKSWLVPADVVILPYVKNEYTETVMPAKSYEVLATGRPVVATPLPELVERFSGLMTFVSNSEEWVEAIESALARSTPGSREAQRQCARENSWPARYEQFKTLVESIS